MRYVHILSFTVVDVLHQLRSSTQAVFGELREVQLLAAPCTGRRRRYGHCDPVVARFRRGLPRRPRSPLPQNVVLHHTPRVVL